MTETNIKESLTDYTEKQCQLKRDLEKMFPKDLIQEFEDRDVLTLEAMSSQFLGCFDTEEDLFEFVYIHRTEIKNPKERHAFGQWRFRPAYWLRKHINFDDLFKEMQEDRDYGEEGHRLMIIKFGESDEKSNEKRGEAFWVWNTFQI